MRMISVEELRLVNQEGLPQENLAELSRLGGVHVVAHLLGVDVEQGLPQSEIDDEFAARRERFGRNTFAEAPCKSLGQLFVDSLQDTTLVILIVAALASLVTGYLDHPDYGWSEGVAILVGVFLVATITSLNDYSKEKQFRALSAKNDDVQVKVLRHGKPDLVSVGDINVGEIVVLETGDRVPADAIYIRGQDLLCNESSLTGEPEEVAKSSSKDPFLYSSCLVAVGSESRWGKIKANLVREQRATPLMEKLEVMATHIGYVGMFFAVATMVTMLVIFALSDERQRTRTWPDYILHAFLVGVTIIVVAIPEGLPLAVTISLSYSTKKMLKDNNLIRVLAACETMGNVTSICSDKTGTLTENKMTVVQGWILGRVFGREELEQHSELPVDKEALKQLMVNVAVNTSAFLQKTGDSYQVRGSKTEGALLLWMDQRKSLYASLRIKHFRPLQGDRLFPFSSEKKTMSAIVRVDDGFKLFCKGAADVVLARATHYVNEAGATVKLTTEKREELEALITRMADTALRTICVAHRDLRTDELPDDLQTLQEAPEDQLVVDAIFGIQDPLRPEVSDAIRDCQRAGIMVRMVTGDNIHTASAIARQCGILTSEGVALEGPVFRMMKPDELNAVLPRLQVLARSSPDDKYKLVKMLQARSEVVGVTGDGTNDAPALRAADVGMSMGIAGTDLAKEASDIVIMDDKFSSIRKAVLWGRCVYDNIRKFLQFQLTVNIAALVITLVSALGGMEPPLNSVMMLWINLIMDTMGALALGTEAPTDALLDRRPYKRDARLLSSGMLKNIMFQAVFQIFLVFFLLSYGADYFGFPEGNACLEYVYELKKSVVKLNSATCRTVSGGACSSMSCSDYTHTILATGKGAVDYAAVPLDCLNEQCMVFDYRHYTVIFNTFVFCQVFNEFNARRTNNDWNVFRGVLHNKLFIFIILITVGVQVVLAEFGNNFTETSPITMEQWLVCFGLGALSLPVGEFRVPCFDCDCFADGCGLFFCLLGLLMRCIPIVESPDAFANPNGIDVENHIGKNPKMTDDQVKLVVVPSDVKLDAPHAVVTSV
ncbi:TPA: hypothetical protein N0F65_010292 [Lagenidium giganteum]|uniref:Calcium-transporting ATPase n=1 Tax=Lagenidium giganteum TaxID=4803 RepID=A0AAV2Z5J4_9STRA|nr:TPA: hypothetical protein N0F65_010292 [Lagenidium giganteum]